MQANGEIKQSHRKRGLWWLLGVLGLILILLAVWTIFGRKPSSSLPANLEEWMTFEVLKTYPHDSEAFTQGLVYQDGALYESTGLYGESSLRKVALETGEVLKRIDLPPEYFGEGLAIWEETLVQLTWRAGTGFVYNLEDFSMLGHFTYPTEGWGLTQDGQRLIMSDGTDKLFFLDPETFQVIDSVSVTWEGEPVHRLNELEFIRGEIFANIWQTDNIVRIDPQTGEVTGWIDLRGILPPESRTPDTDVLNGIAYDPEGDRLFVTGKFWPVLYKVKLIPITEGD